MPSKYDPIVDALCKHGVVTIEVHKANVDLTIAMVKKQKCGYNKLRKALNLPGLAQMEIAVNPSKVSSERRSITFKLLFSVNLI